MKKLLHSGFLACVMLLLLLASQSAYAQCTSSTAYEGATANNFNTPQTLTTCTFGGEYSPYSGVTSGNTYTFTATGGAGNFITIRQTNGTGTVVASGLSPLTGIVSPISGVLAVVVHVNAGCTTDASCHTLVATCTSCPAPPVFAPINIPTIPVTNQALVCNTANDYNATNVPAVCGSATNAYKGGNEAVYTFTPSVTGSYDISISGVTWTSIFVYAGNPTSGGTCVNSVGTSASSKSLTVTLTAGTEYYIWFDTNPTPNSPCPGTFSLAMTPPPPANDNCAGAIALAINSDFICVMSTAGTTVSATQSAETAPSCSATGVNDDVWYSFTATGTSHRVTITGATNTTVAAVYSGSCGGLTQLISACSSTSLGTLNLNLTGLSAATTYLVRVYTLVATVGTTSNFTICIGTPPPPPANDNCPGAVAFGTILNDGVCVNATISTDGATGSLDAVCFGAEDDDVWYTFTTPAGVSSLLYTNTTISGNGDRMLQVYSGGCAGLTSIGCYDSESGTFTGLAGSTTYYLRAFTYGSGVNTVFNLCLRTVPPPPANDECANAVPISVGASCNFTQYTNAGATGSVGPPAPGCAGYSGGDVWFSAVVPATGRLIVDTNTGVVTDGGMAIYSGNCGVLTLIECDDDDSANGLMPMIDRSGLIPGATIYIRFWEYSNDNNGTFSLCVWTPAPPCNAPGTPVVSNITSNSASVSWSGAAGAVSYDWTVGTGASCPTGTGANTASTSANLNNLIPNTTYRVCVRTSSCGGGSPSSYVTMTFTTPPLSNDACVGAIPLVCNSTVNGSTIGALSDAAMGICSTGTGGTPGNGVWYSLAGDGSQITLSLCGSSYDTKVHVYSGSCGSLICETSNDDSGVCGNSRSHVVFNTSPSTTYYILVSGFGSNTGAFSLNVGCVCGAPLSFPWSNNAIGSATGEGIDNVCGGSIDISSTGYSSSSSSDALFFSNQSLCGNQSITVKLDNITNGGFAGIMFRDSTNAGSRYVAIKTQLNTFVHREMRTVLNGAKQSQQLPAPGHTWLRLTRNGNTFTGFTSTNGSNWKQAFSVNVTLNNCLRVGLFTQGLNPTSTAQAQFTVVNGFPDDIQIGLQLPSANISESVQGLTIFPNPTSNELNLKIETVFLGKDITINVMDQMGRIVMSKNVNDLQTQHEQINVSNLPDGMYILSLSSEGYAAQIQKFIVSGNRP